jgi:creatinine amidohydrolase
MEKTPEAHGRLLEEMTWPEVERAVADGRTTVVVAVAATEQHGPHLPLLVDAVRGDRLALEVARLVGEEALVAPTIRVGCSEHHMSFAGTISLRRSTLEAICMDYCVSLARHGFRRICLVPSHGGNFGPLSDMLDDLRSAVAPDCEVVAYTDLLGFMEVWVGAVGEVSEELAGRVGGHADVAETSEIMVLRPELVHEDRMAEGYVGGADPAVFQRIFTDGLRAVTSNGILGDPRGASVEIGRRCIARAAEAVARGLADG